MPQGISVIICCFNSATRIRPTLEHLAKQMLISTELYEVIVIDNASTDNTAQVCEQYWNEFENMKPGFKIVSEKRAGLSWARLKGIHEALFDYVLFCDDDNWLAEDYLINAFNLMKGNPEIGILGGTGAPVFEKKEPPYFWVNQYHALAVGPQASHEGDITDTRPVVYGAGMILNKKAFKELENKYGFQFMLTDRIGNSLVSSGDHELCLAVIKAGYRIFCSEKLKFKHFIPEARTTIDYYKKLFFGFGTSYAQLKPYFIKKKDLNNFRNDYRYICLRCLKNMTLLSVSLFFSGYYFKLNQYKNLAKIHGLYKNYGLFLTAIKMKNQFKQQFYSSPLFFLNP